MSWRRRVRPVVATTSRRVLLTPTRDDLIDAGLLAILTVLALIGLRTTYPGWMYLIAGVAGLLLGLIIAHLSNALSQPMIAVAAATLAVFFLLGGAIALHSRAVAGLFPNAGTLHGLADESIHGWKDLLTTLPPVDGNGPLLVLPYILGLLCGVGGLCLARRVRASFAPVAVPFVALIVVILLGTGTPAARVLQGGVFGAVALCWIALRSQRMRAPVRNGSGRMTRLATVGVLLVLAGGGAALVGPHAPGTGSHGRTVLRKYVTPPFDIGRYPSPLASFRAYTKPAHDHYDKTLFTVHGLPAGSTVRIATLDDYDGNVWAASNRPGEPGSVPDTFQRVGPTIRNPAQGKIVTLQVTIGADYDNVWLPDAGAVQGVTFHGEDAGTHATYFRYNLATGTGVVPGQLRTGDSYTVRTVLPRNPKLDAHDVLATSGAMPAEEGAFLRTQAAQWSGSSASHTAAVLALARHLYSVGKYTDGEPPNQYYLPGHYRARLEAFVGGKQIVGDDEQYAAAFALMVNQLGVPARVVFGADPEPNGVVKGKDVHAWVEVQLADGAWREIPQTEFMNRNAAPTKLPPQQQQRATGKIVPPPVRVKPRSSLADAAAANSQSLHENAHKHHRAGAGGGFHIPAFVITAARWGGPPVLVIVLCCATIMGIKATRRHRRRTRGSAATRFARGWREIVDCARDLGTTLPGGMTRREQGALLGAHGVTGLARAADAYVFGPAVPDELQAAAYWADVDTARKQMRRRVGRWRRIRAAVSFASLRRVSSAPAEVTP